MMPHNSLSELSQSTNRSCNANQCYGPSVSITSRYSDASSRVQFPVPEEKPEWKLRLENFVDSFVKEIETKFEVYKALLEDMENVNGKLPYSFSEGLGKKVGGTGGIVLGYIFSLPGGVSSIGREVGGVVGKQVSGMRHKDKRESLSQLIYYYQGNKVAQREILFQGSFQVFESYEMQIMGLKGEIAWQTYVRKLGLDAAHRLIVYCSKGYINKFTLDVVTKGVVQGISKKETPWIPIKRGLEIQYQGQVVTTKDIFTEVDLADLENENLYMKDRDHKESKYGHRILFSWESGKSGGIGIDSDKYYKIKYKPQASTYTSVFKTENKSTILNELNSQIFSEEKHVLEETTKQVLQELKDDVIREITEKLQDVGTGPVGEDLQQMLEQIANLVVEDYAKQLQVYLEKNNYELQQVVERDSSRTRDHVSQEHEGTRAVLQSYTAEKHEEMQLLVQEESSRTRQLLTGELAKTRAGQEAGQQWRNIMLDFQGHVDTFIGRAQDLKDLCMFLHSEDGKRRVVVCGLGGVGKSELVRKYAAQHCLEYHSNIEWMNAESYSSLRSSFLRLAVKVGVKTQEGTTTELAIIDLVSKVYDEMGDKCLFIFDDAQKCRNEDIADEGIKIFLPDGIIRKPHVIITSYMSDWDTSIPRINLKVFEKKETLCLLQKILTNKFSMKEAIVLGELLGHLPLALQIAAAYINDQDITIDKFIQEYEQKKVDILTLGFPSGSMDNSMKTVFTTFQIILGNVLVRCGAETTTILNILAYLNPDNISRELVSGLGEEITVRNIIQTLKKCSLITQKTDGRVLQMHKLVQYVIRKSWNNSEEDVLGKLLYLLKFKMQMETDDLIVQQAEYIWQYAGNYPALVKQYHGILKFPLHQAVQVRSVEMVKCLLEETDIYIYAKDRGGMTALYRASQQEANMEIIKYLISQSSEHDFTEHKKDWKILEKAAEENKRDILKFLIDESGADKDLWSDILLHLAAQKGRLDVVVYLINNGANIHYRRSDSTTVLHEAAFSNNSSVIEFVLESIDVECNNETEVHAFINAKDKAGDTPLMWAAKAWKTSAVRTFLDHRADVSVKNKEGKTALELADQTADKHEDPEQFLSLLR
ncbi:hypothetical protein PR048_026963 [Dryococelus australis]|uniref:Uncharacterized protein n=1 Tax=Dryococelus australis TaxID=614101 RepID=A0ABQ9GMU6_9NEOP|nr:hypothetical protein PR048_026963 [Dryococelus australis]